GGMLSTNDPSLRVRDGALDVILYPVTVIAIDGSAVRQVPAEVLRLPVAPRFFWGAESVLPKEELVAEGATFKRLTLYMMGNTQGLGYRVVPSERAFHVAPSGVTVLDEQGKPATDRGVYTEGKFTVVLPKVSVPVMIRGEGVSASIAGPAGSFSGKAPDDKEFRGTFYAFSAEGGANVRFGLRAENGPFLFHGDFGVYPRRKLLIDATRSPGSHAPASREPRLLAVALPAGSAKSGGTVRIRVEARDAIDAATITPLEVGAWLLTRPVLRDDALLESAPDAATPLAAWRSLRIEPTDQADTYLADIPADLPSNVYWIRIVAAARGACSPNSPLQADFVQGVINPAARSTLSIFCPIGQHAFLRGSDLPFSVVAKTTAAIPAGTLTVVLKGDREEFPLVERQVPELTAGCHPFHCKLDGAASAALKPGTYFLQARIGVLASNAWELDIVEPRDRAGTPYVDDGWLAPQVDEGRQYLNVPADIRQANAKRELLRRNTLARARRGTNIDIVDWSGFAGGHGCFQGRDSSSEVAQVEMLLRNELALPAHEVYYYQNHVEAVNESLARCGIDNITSTPCIISILSLVHSLKDQVDATMRQHQLIAQIVKKFDNFIGLNPMFMSTSPLGNSEIPDPTRPAAQADGEELREEVRLSVAHVRRRHPLHPAAA
ncbi:MAG TPA: hypothetical protein VM223_14530, partial [Planctomycetota bacterium]|nr:hypothetical protein [Planctomycetota bacterium]